MPLLNQAILGLQFLFLTSLSNAEDVFAHFMVCTPLSSLPKHLSIRSMFQVQNSYSYTQADWAADIAAAQAIGIDGFGKTHSRNHSISN